MPHSASPSSPFLSSQPLPSLSGNPDHTVPWGMQIAVRYDKVHPPRRIDVAEAAARAVVSLLASPAAAPGGPWNPAVDYWRDGRIRKLVRRARGKRWEEVQDIDGVRSRRIPTSCRAAGATAPFEGSDQPHLFPPDGR